MAGSSQYARSTAIRHSPVGFSEVIAQERGDVHRHRRTHCHFELKVTEYHRAEDDIEIAVKLDVARTDEGVVEAADPLGSQVRPRADRVLDPAVGGKQPYPAGAVVRGGRLR